MEFVQLTVEEMAGVSFSCDNFLQSVEMYRRYQGIGRESYLVGVKRNDGIIAAGLILARPWRFGKKIFRVAGGWLMDYDSNECGEILNFLTERVKGFCRKKGGMMLEIAPNLEMQPRDGENNVLEGGNHLGVKRILEELGYRYLGEYAQVKWQFVLDLDKKTEDEILMSLRSGHRRWIRRAEREGVRVRELEINEIEVLKRIIAQTGERQGFRDPDIEYYQSMKEYFGAKVEFVVAEMPEKTLPSDGDLIKTKDGYVALAAAMFVKDAHEMIYLYGGSVRILQKYGGAHLIQWWMLQEALKLGYIRYNFYGTHPIEGNGVYNFKLGFRGRVEELLGTFVLPIGLIGGLYVKRLKEQEYGEIH